MSSTQAAPGAVPNPMASTLVRQIEGFMHEVREAAAYLKNLQGARRYSLTRLREVTGLHKNSLIRISDVDWAPKPDTMNRLALIIERAKGEKLGETFADQPVKRGRPRRDAETVSRVKKRKKKQKRPASRR